MIFLLIGSSEDEIFDKKNQVDLNKPYYSFIYPILFK